MRERNPFLAHGFLVALAAVLVALVASAPASAQSRQPVPQPPQMPAPAPAPLQAPDPTTPAPTSTVLVLRMPANLGPDGVRRLATELRAASTVVVRVPSRVELAPSVTAGALQDLARAARDTQLILLGAEDGDIEGFVTANVRFEQIGSVDDLRARLGDGRRIEALDAGSLSTASLNGLVGSREDGGGVSRLLLLAAALAVAGLALAATRRRHPREQRTASDPPTPRRPAARSFTRGGVVESAGLPASGRALVRSELRPEGYVELASCLRRARWGEPRIEPPAPGGWVDVRADNGRLIAFPAHARRNGGRS
jgi:hypothetical protein